MFERRTFCWMEYIPVRVEMRRINNPNGPEIERTIIVSIVNVM